MTTVNKKVIAEPQPISEQAPHADQALANQAAAPAVLDAPDQSLSSIKFCGINIIGIDPRLISSAILNMEIPLHSGKNTVMGMDKDAKIKIKDGTSATVSLMLARNCQGLL